MGGVGQHNKTPGSCNSELPRPYGGGKFHFLHGDKQATTLLFLYTLKSPTSFSLIGQSSEKIYLFVNFLTWNLKNLNTYYLRFFVTKSDHTAFSQEFLMRTSPFSNP